MTPSGRIFGAQRDRPVASLTRQTKLACPECGATISVYEDEVGRAGDCPGCGARIAVPAEAFSGTRPAYAEGATGAVVRAALVQPVAQPAPEPAHVAEGLEVSAGPLLTGSGRAESGAPSETRANTGIDYLLWQGLAEQAGDWAMAVRLGALRRAEEAGCELSRQLPDGSRLPVPQMLLGEAAVAAFQALSEAEWRRDWTHRLLRIAARWPEEAIVDAVVTILMQTDAAIAELRAAGVWPWARA